MGERAYQLLAVIAVLSLAHVAPVLARGGSGVSAHSGFHARVVIHGPISKRTFSVSRHNNLRGNFARSRYLPNEASAWWWPYWPTFGTYDGQANEAPVSGEMIVIPNPSSPTPGSPVPLMVSNVTAVSGCHPFPDGHGYHCDGADSGAAQPTP